MTTALVRLKHKAVKSEFFPSFSIDGKDELYVHFNSFTEENKKGEREVKKEFKDFFKNLTEHDLLIAEYFQDKDKKLYITKIINMEKRLPSDTRIFLDALPIQGRDNFGLLNQKAAAFKGDKFWLLNEQKTALTHPFRRQAYQKLIAAIQKRHESQLAAFRNLNYIPTTLPIMQVKGRLVVGLGSESVYEMGMTLHPIYGIPYLPASAIKGVLRNFLIANLFRDSEDKASEKEALKDPVFCQLFGCPKDSISGKAVKGRVVFFDAFPLDNVTIAADVMTPHYQKYYMDEKAKIPPADWLEPNPVVFLTVEKPKFALSFAIRKNMKWEVSEWKRLAEMIGHTEFLDKKIGDIIKTWLPKALLEYGIGAKTAVGYGRMV